MNTWDEKMPKTVSISNLKGGVGKTITTINLAAAFGQMGKKILAIDACLSGDMTRCLVPMDVQRAKTKTNSCKSDSLENITHESTTHNVDIIFAEDFVSIVGRSDIGFIGNGLQRVLKNSNLEKYDYILIDTPTRTEVAKNVRISSDAEIIPIESFFSVSMLAEMLANVQHPARKRQDRPLDAHILITFFDPNTETGKQILRIKDEYENYALETDIPMDPALRDFTAFKGSIFDYEPNCEGAIAYMKLAEELIEKWENDYENVCTDFSINEEE